MMARILLVCLFFLGLSVLGLGSCTTSNHCSKHEDCARNEVCNPSSQQCEIPCRSDKDCQKNLFCNVEGLCSGEPQQEKTVEVKERSSEKQLEKENPREMDASVEKKTEVLPEKEVVLEKQPEKKEYIQVEKEAIFEEQVSEEPSKEKTMIEEIHQEIVIDVPDVPVGSCGSCVLGTFTCFGGEVRVCKNTGTQCNSWELQKTCANDQLCFNHSCRAKVDCLKSPAKWPFLLKSLGSDHIHSIAISPKEQMLYATGYFSKEAIIEGKIVKATGGLDLFFLKMNLDGKIIWFKTLPTKLSVTESRGKAIAFDTTGNAILALTFTGEININGSLVPKGSEDAILVVFSPSGQLLKVFAFGGTGTENIHSITVDSNGDYLVAGEWQNTMSLKNTQGNLVDYVSKGGRDGFVGKIDSQTGDFLWVKTFQGSGQNIVHEVRVNSSNQVWVAGEFSDTLTLPDASTKSSLGSSDGMVFQLASSDGSLQKKLWIQGAGKEKAYSLAINSKNEIFVTGRMDKNTDFNATTTLSSVGSGDVFLLKLSSVGGVDWVKSFGPSNLDKKNYITVGKNDSIGLSGYFTQTIQQGSFQMKAKGGYDLFALFLDSQGIVQWGESFDLAAYEFGSVLALDANNGMYIASSFYTQGTIGKSSFSSLGFEDSFVAKIRTDGSIYSHCLDSTNGSEISVEKVVQEEIAQEEIVSEKTTNDAGVLPEPEPSQEKSNPETPIDSINSCTDCVVNATKCTGNDVMECNFNGSCNVWVVANTCNSNEQCQKGLCVDKTQCNQSSEKWPFYIASSQHDQIKSVYVDKQDNVYITGFFIGTMEIAGKQYTSKSLHDFFLVKLKKDGTFQWLKTFDSSSTSEDIGWEMKADSAGNLWVSLSFTGQITLDKTYKIVGGDDIVLVKLDPQGNVLFSTKIGGKSTNFGYSLDIDSQGNIWLAGQFRETLEAGSITLTTQGNVSDDRDIFVLKMTPTGTFLWAKQFGGSLQDIAYKIRLDSKDNAWIAGTTSGSITLGSQTFVSKGKNDGIVFKLDSQGNVLKALTLGGVNEDRAYSLAVHSTDEVYVTGRFGKQSSFGSSLTLSSLGDGDTFLMKLDANASILWVKSFGPGSVDNPNDIQLDSQGNPHFTGNFQGTISQGSVSVKAKGGLDLFVLKVSSQGDLVWGQSIDLAAYYYGTSLALDSNNDVYLASTFYSTIQFKTNVFGSSGYSDAFVTKISNTGALFSLCEP